jgi:hypothetical protein
VSETQVTIILNIALIVLQAIVAIVQYLLSRQLQAIQKEVRDLQKQTDVT